jgi:acetoin utilization protein AcuB
MLVRDWMTRRPVTVRPSTSVLEARRLLSRHGVRHLPVAEGDDLVGLLSSRDLQVRDDTLLQALSGLQSDLVSGMYRPVDTVMTRTPLVARPGDSVTAAASTMVTMRIGALPVVEGLRLVGILSLVDCVRALLAGQGHPSPAIPTRGPAAAAQEVPA